MFELLTLRACFGILLNRTPDCKGAASRVVFIREFGAILWPQCLIIAMLYIVYGWDKWGTCMAVDKVQWVAFIAVVVLCVIVQSAFGMLTSILFLLNIDDILFIVRHIYRTCVYLPTSLFKWNTSKLFYASNTMVLIFPCSSTFCDISSVCYLIFRRMLFINKAMWG